MDQAAKLREIASKRNDIENNINMISIISGKGGVGKTTLVTKLYLDFNNSFIVDSDINAPYFWLYENKYNCCEGFENFNGKLSLKNLDKYKKLDKYNYVFVDAGTGINEINQYFINKSKLIVFVTTMEEISILNTINLMKKINGKKTVFILNANDDQVKDMQNRVNRYARVYLNEDYIKIFNNKDDLESYINLKIIKN